MPLADLEKQDNIMIFQFEKSKVYPNVLIISGPNNYFYHKSLFPQQILTIRVTGTIYKLFIYFVRCRLLGITYKVPDEKYQMTLYRSHLKKK